jgi:hypothetical protein
MPNPEPPIACSLDADSLKERLGELRALGRDALLGADTVRGRSTLCFAAGGETRARLEAIVAAEVRCCPFLSFTLDDAPDAIVMTISAPEGAEPVVAELVAAFSAGQVAA